MRFIYLRTIFAIVFLFFYSCSISSDNRLIKIQPGLLGRNYWWSIVWENEDENNDEYYEDE